MAKNKKVSLFAAILAVAVVGVLGTAFVVRSFSGGSPKVVVEGNMTFNEASVNEASIGATPGTDHYSPERFHSGFSGQVLATSTKGSSLNLTEDVLQTNSVIEMTSLMSNVTYTFPATSTLSSLMQNPGDTMSWIIKNANTSTSATTLTLVAGTGWDFVGVDANVDILAARSFGILNCYRESPSSTLPGARVSDAKNIMCAITNNIAAD